MYRIRVTKSPGMLMIQQEKGLRGSTAGEGIFEPS